MDEVPQWAVELRQWIPLFLHYPAGMVIGYLLLKDFGSFIGPIIRQAVERWVGSHVELVHSLKQAVEGVVGKLANIEDVQKQHRAETANGFDTLKERLK